MARLEAFPAMNRAFWVTVEHAPGRTHDHRIHARSAWSAAWLFRQLNPGSIVRMIRPVPGLQEAIRP